MRLRARGVSETFRDFAFVESERVLTLAAFPLWEVSTKIIARTAPKRLELLLNSTFPLPVPEFMPTYDARELPDG